MEYLEPINDKRQSFYGKAKTYKSFDVIRLRSYDTDILDYNTTTKELKFLTKNKNHFTQTTTRHIREFLYQYTDKNHKASKQELLKMAGV